MFFSKNYVQISSDDLTWTQQVPMTYSKNWFCVALGAVYSAIHHGSHHKPVGVSQGSVSVRFLVFYQFPHTFLGRL